MPIALNQIVISFKLNKQTAFQYGQAYVAPSRVRTLNGLLFLIGLTQSKLKHADQSITGEYERLPFEMETDLLLSEGRTIVKCVCQ